MISSTGKVCASAESIARHTSSRRLNVGMIAETWTMSAMLKDLSKKALYASGLLGLYHRIRNADTLTVVMFHRILAPDDPRFASSDPDYTLTIEVFGQCLAFFGRHYSVVSEAEVLASRAEGRALPRNALLVTFDDGWSDNADHALPVMRKFGFPGLLFVVSDVIGTRQPFVQEAIVAAWRRGALTVAGLSAAIDAIAGSPAPRAAASSTTTACCSRPCRVPRTTTRHGPAAISITSRRS